MEKEKAVLKIENLRTTFTNGVQAVRGVDLTLFPSEIVGIVGESGCGKSVMAKSIMGILPRNGKVVGGRILFQGVNLLDLKEREMRRVRGNDISLIFQDSLSALNPSFTIGYQVEEVIKEHHTKMKKKEIRQRALELLREVKLTDPELRMRQYPHELSGGMRQRVVIAMALANNPDILIADEPTTALDVTIQAQILYLVRELKDKLDKSILFITHDLGVVAEVCDRVVIMYAGIVVESGRTDEIFSHAAHPYTSALLQSLPEYQSDDPEGLFFIPGTPPNLANEIPGCPFAPRCPYAMRLCEKREPEYITLDEKGHGVRCFLHMPEFKKYLEGNGVDHG